MEQQLLAELVKSGLLFAVLAYAAWYLARELKDYQKAMQERVDKAEAQCAEDRKALAAELAKVRDQQHSDQRELLIAASAALTTNAKALERSAEALARLAEIQERREGSGMHLAIDRKTDLTTPHKEA